MSSSSIQTTAAKAIRVPRWWLLLGLVVLLVPACLVGWRWARDRTLRKQALAVADRDRFEVALPLLLEAYQRHPDDGEIVKALAIGYDGTNNVTEAEAFLNRWCELAADNAEPFRRRTDW